MKKVKLFHLPTPLQHLGTRYGNELFIKRDDTIDFVFGGNKARKIEYFLKVALDEGANCLATYGSFNSNHCRITAAAAARYHLGCVLICEDSMRDETLPGNELLIGLLGARRVWCDVKEVAPTIERELSKLRLEGKRPYFIKGGGHDLPGVFAYIQAYREMLGQISEPFDYIFLASGTGTTQAGLIIGQALSGGREKIIGVSTARLAWRGNQEIENCVRWYSDYSGQRPSIPSYLFCDDYLCGGNRGYHPGIGEVIREALGEYSLVLDPFYTGKAFYGMREYLAANSIKNKRILFWHTGGQPMLLTSAGRRV